jgi:glycogen operon protein
MDWKQVEENLDLLRFSKAILKFRNDHPVLRSRNHFQHRDYMGSGLPDISFHGTHAWNCDYSAGSRCFAFMLCGMHAKEGSVRDDDVYVGFNMYWDALPFQLPRPRQGADWRIVVNTGMASPEDICDTSEALPLGNPNEIIIGSRSIVILIAS